jgi:signal transduction histidine kinase
MNTPLRALMVEDTDRDAELLVRELRRSFDVDFERVQTAEAMSAALDNRTWDIIFCNCSNPPFDAQAALSLTRKKGFDLPFIIVSGTVGEESAIGAMKAGAHDYFLKDKLGPRLSAAIERELREAKDRAERTKMQEQLMMSDRMVSMGTLAAGVAHEINNPLASVMANIELAAADIANRAAKLGMGDDFNELREELDDARVGAERIRNIVRDLKIFSRAEEDERGVVDVHRILDSTLRMAWNEIRHRAQLVKSYGEIPPVQANESRLGQVFLNLVVNAAQAITEGRAESNAIHISTRADREGWVIVEVADTGPGIPPEVLARLFTPFFTTKAVGEGTGLGLSICHRIVTSLGGLISVDSQMGKGTTFRVSLPPARFEVFPNAPPFPTVEVAASRRGRVLVVDDEPMITKAVQRMLSAEHEVLTIHSADEALRRISAGERFDVILCDLMMPQMTGMDLYAELLRVTADQATQMIFLTGGTFTSRARSFLDKTPNQRIEKPFSATQLRALVNDQIRRT